MTARKVSADSDRELAKLQLDQTDPEAVQEQSASVTEGDKKYDTVELKGEKFRLREKVGAMALFKWSAAADMGTDDPRALGAIYAMLKSVILKADWGKFEEHALDTDADADELLTVVTKGLEIISGRPTGRQSGS